MAKDVRICFLGDSLVQGAGDEACLGWPGRLSQLSSRQGAEVTCYNLGIRREDTGGLRKRMAVEIPPRFEGNFTKRIVISTGYNDTRVEDGQRNIEVERSVENMREILKWSRSVCKTLVVGVAAANDSGRSARNKELCLAFFDLSAKLGIPYVPFNDFTRNDPFWLPQAQANDGVHPGAEAYDAAARFIYRNPDWVSFVSG